jgi:hypothetical protein
MSEARDLLRQLLQEVLAESGNGVVPQVPAPPTAAVLRPSNWGQPAAPGEVIGSGESARVEPVRLTTDDDLARFVSHVLANSDAIRAGSLRFTFGKASSSNRIERGAVTERTVNEAAKAGGKLVLGKAAVLTPLARERARALNIEIERER